MTLVKYCFHAIKLSAYFIFELYFIREHTQFLDFAYPELDASSKPNYTAVEGYDRNLKV